MQMFLESIINRLAENFDPTVLGIQFADGIANFIVGVLVFGAYFLLELVVQRLSKPVMERTQLDETARSFVRTIIKYTIFIIGAVNAFGAMGINTESLLASIGIAGVTIGFAARDAFSNLISGLMIFLDRPFVIGDLVEVGENYGRVDQITLRSTRIITSDGKMLAVPNNEMINKTVASYTNFPHLRLDIGVTVGVEEDLERVRRLLLGLVEGDEDFLESPAPRVVVRSLNDYNVAMELQVWLKNEREHVQKRSDLREMAFNQLNQAKVEMPFETVKLMPLSVELVEG